MGDDKETGPDAYDDLLASLTSFREELWQEYEIAQRKIDNSTRFRIIILGWSLTAASLVSAAVGLSKLPRSTSGIALGFVALLLIVVHKLATDHVATGLALGERARTIERELHAAQKLAASLRRTGRAKINETAVNTGAGQKNARSRGKKRTNETHLIERVRKKCLDPTPRIGLVATSNRLGLRHFMKICGLSLISIIPGLGKSKKFSASIISAQHILWVQLGFIAVGLVLSLTPTGQSSGSANHAKTWIEINSAAVPAPPVAFPGAPGVDDTGHATPSTPRPQDDEPHRVGETNLAGPPSDTPTRRSMSRAAADGMDTGITDDGDSSNTTPAADGSAVSLAADEVAATDNHAALDETPDAKQPVTQSQ